MVGSRHLVFLAVAVFAHASIALPVFQEEQYEGHSEHHHAPPATSYATISTTHVKVQHPPVAPSKYSTPYKYEYLTQPQTAYKYISLPSLPAAGKHEQEQPASAPNYKYLAASPTYKYVQPPAVTTEPEAAEEPTNPLKYAFKYEQTAFNKEQEQLQQQQQADYEQPAVQYKYIAVPSYKYVQRVAPSEYQQPAAATSFGDYGGDDKQQY